MASPDSPPEPDDVSNVDTEMVKPRGNNKQPFDNSPELPTLTEGQELQIEPQSPKRTESVGSRNSLSASKMCASGPEFKGWAIQNNVSLIDGIWSNEEFDTFMRSLKYPTCIKEDAIFKFMQELLSTFNPGRVVLEAFEIWRDSHRPEQFEDGDQYAFRLCLSYILVSWTILVSKIRKFGKQGYYKGTVGLLEMDLALPGTPDLVRADAVAMKAIPELWDAFIAGLKKPWNFSWAYSQLPMSVLTFIVEEKVDDLETAERQIQMGLFSAQKQRRALAMKDGPVFGAILNKGSLLFYVSFWDTNKLIIQRVLESYSLRDLCHFVEAYFVLCRIAEFQSQWLDNEFRRWDEGRRSKVVQLKQSESKNWRKEKTKSRSKKGSQAGDINAQDGEGDTEGDTIEDLGEAGLDDDQEVEGIRMAVAHEPFPEDGYSLTRKRLYVLIKMPEESQAVRASPISEWVKRMNACAGEFTHVYSPEYDAYFEDDRASTTVADSESTAGTFVEEYPESNIATLVGDDEKSPDKALMVEKLNVDVGLHDSRLTGEAGWNAKHPDAILKFCHYGEVERHAIDTLT